MQRLSDPGLRVLSVQLGGSLTWPVIYCALQLENLLQPQASLVGKKKRGNPLPLQLGKGRENHAR